MVTYLSFEGVYVDVRLSMWFLAVCVHVGDWNTHHSRSSLLAQRVCKLKRVPFFVISSTLNTFEGKLW